MMANGNLLSIVITRDWGIKQQLKDDPSKQINSVDFGFATIYLEVADCISFLHTFFLKSFENFQRISFSKSM